ncbi:MAG: hypothetical protein HGA54_10190 [Actinobacteria bacterium]|nr:hypothetical protein [Actinomycetota bacterium]
MTKLSTPFDIRESLDVDQEFDSFQDFETAEDEEDSEDIGLTLGAPKDSQALAVPVDDRPAAVRTAELFQRMAPHKKILLGILAACDATKPAHEIGSLVEQLQETKYSVYNATTLCALLEKAGALERVEVKTAGDEVSEDITAEDKELQAKTVEVDGIQYMEVQKPAETQWLTTEAGRLKIAENKPRERMSRLFEDEERYKPIYKWILTMCAGVDGSTTPLIEEAIDNDPLLLNPRYYASRFIDKLEQCEAIVWSESWRVNDLGREGLELLADIDYATNTTRKV